MEEIATIFADDIFKCIFMFEICYVGSSNGLALNKQQAITWTNAGPVHWRI